MFKGVSKWLGVVDNTNEEEIVEVNAEGEEKVTKVDHSDTETKGDNNKTDTGEGENQENDDLISPQTKQTLEEVSAKAITTAKEWGSMFSTLLHKILINDHLIFVYFQSQ